MVLVSGPALVEAASCNGASHTPSLSGGHVEPRLAPAGTAFRFTVTYRDNGNCAPNYLRVQVAGVGTFAMSGTGTNYGAGVVFERQVRLTAPGTYTYDFVASSGSGAGTKAVHLTDVRPRSFTVTAPSPTPKPTPRPTAVATPRPTTAPTSPPRATARPTKAPAATPKPTKRPRPASFSPSPGATQSPGALVGPRPTDRPGGFRVPGHPRPAEGGIDLFAVFDVDLDPVALRLVEWTAITGGGLLLLFFLASRRRSAMQPALAEAGPSQAASPAAPAPALPSAMTPEPAPTVRRDEENMPRWLRPSVRAGRQGRSLED